MKKILILFVIFAALWAAGCRQKQEPTQQPGNQAPQAPSLLQMTLLQEAAKKTPKNPQAWIALGNGMMDSQRFDEAVKAYQKALALQPKNVDVRVDLGTCYRGIGKFDKAVEEYRKALKINPNHPNAHRNLGVVLASDLHKTAEGIKEFQKYLELAPNAPDAEAIRQAIQKMTAGQ